MRKLPKLNQIICGDTLRELKKFPDNFVDTIITSPPYWGLRDYGVAGQLGLELTLELFIEHLLQITAELKRVLKPQGVMFWNHGDSYCGSQGHFDAKNPKAREGKLIPHQRNYQAKCLFLQNYRLILRMIDEQNWILRNIIIWNKPNHMPSSVKRRFTSSYEPVFMLVKSKKYWFDLDAVRIPCKTNEQRPPGVVRKRIFNYRVQDAERKVKMCPQSKASKTEIERYKRLTGKIAGGGANLNLPVSHHAGKNPGDVWTIPTYSFSDAHFATFPLKLVEPMVKCACPQWICRKCGQPRVRITETQYPNGRAKTGRVRSWNVAPSFGNETPIRKTTGWTDCGCDAGWESGVVLDPFMGAGTTGLVALKLGRQYLGCELNPQYIKIAENRIRKVLVEN